MSLPVRHSVERLELQARQTASLRHPLYQRVGLAQARRVLDVGCGHGAVTRDLAYSTRGHITAVDIDLEMVRDANEHLGGIPNISVQQGDAHSLPFPDGTFDLVVCNLLLMWTRDSAKAVAEMARVVRAGGSVLASMEPDYGGKIHYPENPLVDQVFQGKMIERKGGDPHAGRKLRSWFVGARLSAAVGMSNPHIPECHEDLEMYQRERQFYERALLQAGLSQAQVNSWEKQYLDSLQTGIQFNFLPMFYAIGTKG